MNRSVVMIFAAALAGGCALQAQTNPLIAESKRAYTAIETNLTKAADEMSDANYSFKATPDVRTFGATIAHIADVQMRTCSAVKGEQKQADAASKTAKADLVAALKASFDECDAAWAGITDANATEMLGGRGQRSKLGALIGNTIHDNEEYGYLAVYIRLKGQVPPSSQGRPPM